MSKILKQLSDGLAQTVENLGSRVVRVEARRRLPATGIVWSADGLIITANHVVRADKKIKVGLPDGATVAAELIGRDPTTDLALLKVDASNLQTAEQATDPKVGNLVLALGRPGKTVQATLGIISALGNGWRTGAGGNIDRYLQTDVVMYPGFSGGPLVSADGQLIGLNSSALAQGVSVAIPNATLQRVANTLMTHGRVKRGYLGVSTQAVRLPADAAEALGQETGLLVAGVAPDSPAEKSGLVLGDTIVAFGGTAVRQHDDLLAQLASATIGEKTPAKIVRSGNVQEINLLVGEKE